MPRKKTTAKKIVEPQKPEPKETKKKKNYKPIVYTVAIIILWTVFIALYYYSQHKIFNQQVKLSPEEETKSAVSAIGKLMDLPQDETPTLATVLDKDQLADQPFFKDAENGDELLVYKKNMEVILYRPSTNKIIGISPIINDQQQATPVASPIKIAYYNGTDIAGLATKAEKTVTDAFPDYQTAITSNASLRNYQETLVVDLSGQDSQQAGNIANLLSGKISALPPGETKPDADILVILGQ